MYAVDLRLDRVTSRAFKEKRQICWPRASPTDWVPTETTSKAPPMRDILTFDRLITPVIVRLLQWLYVIVSILGIIFPIGFARWAAGTAASTVDGFILFVLTSVLGFILLRLFIEWFVVIFRVSETVRDIRTEVRRRTGTAASSGSRGGFREILTFRRMILPYIIRVFFWVSIALAVLAVFLVPINAVPPSADDEWYLIVGLLTAVVGAVVILVVRIVAEVVVVLFNIDKDFAEIKELTATARSGSNQSRRSKPTFGEYLGFRRMISPGWLKFCFWVYIAGVVVVGLLLGYGDFLADFIGEDPSSRNEYLVPLILGILLVRIIIEFALVPFSINETIYELRVLIVGHPDAVQSTGGTGSRTFSDFLTFRSMIAPYLIQLLYWIVTLGALYLATVFAYDVMPEVWRAISPSIWSERVFDWSRPAGIALAVVGSVLLLALLLIFIRLYAEQLLLPFKVNENLTDIRNVARRQTGTAAANRPFNFVEYLSDMWAFRRMITPIALQVFYWVISVIVVLVGLAGMLALTSDEGDLLFDSVLGEDNRVFIFFAVLVGAAALLMFIRVVAEAFIVAFRANETLTDIRNADSGHPIFTVVTVTKNCVYCGEPNSIQAVQCGQCGAALSAQPAVASVTPAAPTFATTTAAMKVCPYCAEPIPSQEMNCPYCGSAQQAQPPGAMATAAMKVCPYCAEPIPSAEMICRYCGSQLPTV